MMLRVVVLVGVVACLACGDSGTIGGAYSGSCDLRASFGLCNEYDSQAPGDAGRLASDCATVGASWSDTARCPRAGIIGGCRLPDSAVSGNLTAWYYPGSGYSTADDVRAYCESKGGTFQSP